MTDKLIEDASSTLDTTKKSPSSNDLSVEPEKNIGFFRGFFTSRQQLPHINAERHSYIATVIVSAINATIFYWILKGRAAAATGGGAAGKPGGGGFLAEALANARKMADPLSGKTFRTEHKNTTFKDVIGVPEALNEVKQYVDFLQTPDKFTRLGARLPKGCLLTGDPGTGKTMLAKAVAGEASVPFFSCSGADFIEVYAGSGPRRVRELFMEARDAAPSVVFIDEIDAIGSRGGNNRSAGGVSGEENRTINQILAELDGLSQSDESAPIVVFGATNFPDNLDKAIMREGRFDRKVELPMPDVSARADLFKHYLMKIVMTSDQAAAAEAEQTRRTADEAAANKNDNGQQQQQQNASNDNSKGLEKAIVPTLTGTALEKANQVSDDVAKELAALTPGISPAAISTIVNEAALAAAIKGASKVETSFLREAIDDVLIGRKHRSRMTPEAASRVALHEAGHALIAWLLPQQRPVIKLSITPRGSAGGFSQQLGREPGEHMTDTSLFSDLCVMLGGRGAENTRYGNLSTGAQNDLHRATDLAMKEFLAFGLSPNTMLAFDFNRFEAGRMYQKHSTKLQEDAEKESKILVDEAMACVNELLKAHKKDLDNLHDALLEKTELLPADLERILGKRPDNAGSWSADVHPTARAALDRFIERVVSVAEAVKGETRAEAQLSSPLKPASS